MNIENRLRKLESRLAPRQRWKLTMVVRAPRRQRLQNLAAGDGVVVDWYRDFGGYIQGRKRIPTDEADQGRHCSRGGYLLDVIQEIHQTCYFRERTGSCLNCQ